MSFQQSLDTLIGDFFFSQIKGGDFPGAQNGSRVDLVNTVKCAIRLFGASLRVVKPRLIQQTGWKTRLAKWPIRETGFPTGLKLEIEAGRNR
jgi:hypothetical protein